MDDARYRLLMESPAEPMTLEERAAGWHFCWEWDGLLLGPGMPEFHSDRCAYKIEWERRVEDAIAVFGLPETSDVSLPSRTFLGRPIEFLDVSDVFPITREPMLIMVTSPVPDRHRLWFESIERRILAGLTNDLGMTELVERYG